jgi:hypothetical protein
MLKKRLSCSKLRIVALLCCVLLTAVFLRAVLVNKQGSSSTDKLSSYAGFHSKIQLTSPAKSPVSHFLLTWFTTFTDDNERSLIQRNTLNNWAKLASCCNVQPILFSTNTTRQYDVIARDAGWQVYDVPRVNDYGTPYISDMVNFTMNISTATVNQKSDFYGFANGDVLFDKGLVRTLTSIKMLMTSLPAGRPVLVIGRKTHSRETANRNMEEPKVGFSHIERLRLNGTLVHPAAMDYFFFTPDFPVGTIFSLDMVIGRKYYDNYVVMMARRLRVSVIDATNTLTALHQAAARRRLGKADDEFNVNIIGRFQSRSGRTEYANYETLVSPDGLDIHIMHRATKRILQ